MGRSDKVEETVRRLAEDVSAACGVAVYDIVLRRSGPRWKLQVFLIRAGGNVSLDDCERVSRQLSRELDVLDPIPAGYDLEVSSPGMERALRQPAHWSAACGSLVRIRWRSEEGGSRTALARLERFEEGRITFREGDGPEVSVPLDAVLSARVHVEWGPDPAGSRADHGAECSTAGDRADRA